MSEKLGLDSEVHELKLGSSFTSNSPVAFHSIRYDFKPASVDTARASSVEVNSGHSVTVEVPHVEGSGTSHTVYKGNKRPCQKECVLIIDHKTGEITLERLASDIRLKKTRERQTMVKSDIKKQTDMDINCNYQEQDKGRDSENSSDGTEKLIDNIVSDLQQSSTSQSRKKCGKVARKKSSNKGQSIELPDLKGRGQGCDGVSENDIDLMTSPFFEDNTGLVSPLDSSSNSSSCESLSEIQKPRLKFKVPKKPLSVPSIPPKCDNTKGRSNQTFKDASDLDSNIQNQKEGLKKLKSSKASAKVKTELNSHNTEYAIPCKLVKFAETQKSAIENYLKDHRLEGSRRPYVSANYGITEFKSEFPDFYERVQKRMTFTDLEIDQLMEFLREHFGDYFVGEDVYKRVQRLEDTTDFVIDMFTKDAQCNAEAMN